MRTTSTLAKSTSTTLNAWGLVALLITMWLPVSVRIFDSGTLVSRSPAVAAGAAIGAGAAAAGAAAAGAGAGAAGGGGAAAAGAAGGAAAWGDAAGGVDVVEHVVAGDASARAGAGDRVGIEAVLVHEPPHDR